MMPSFFTSILATACLATATALMAQPVAPVATSSAAGNEATSTSAITTGTAKKWTCTADGLAEFRYDGSGWAFIRLSAYTSGHQYRVTKDETGDIAKGNTQDRTPFVCTNK